MTEAEITDFLNSVRTSSSSGAVVRHKAVRRGDSVGEISLARQGILSKLLGSKSEFAHYNPIRVVFDPLVSTFATGTCELRLEDTGLEAGSPGRILGSWVFPVAIKAIVEFGPTPTFTSGKDRFRLSYSWRDIRVVEGETVGVFTCFPTLQRSEAIAEPVRFQSRVIRVRANNSLPAVLADTTSVTSTRLAIDDGTSRGVEAGTRGSLVVGGARNKRVLRRLGSRGSSGITVGRDGTGGAGNRRTVGTSAPTPAATGDMATAAQGGHQASPAVGGHVRPSGVSGSDDEPSDHAGRGGTPGGESAKSRAARKKKGVGQQHTEFGQTHVGGRGGGAPGDQLSAGAIVSNSDEGRVAFHLPPTHSGQ